MKKQMMASMAIVVVLMVSMFSVLTPKVASHGSVITRNSMKYHVDPYRVQELTAAELDATPSSDLVPFNVDMVNSEPSYTSLDGSGIYVAVLDTGLLSNWVSYFPASQVNIAWSLAKGFTHDYYFSTTVGDFVLGPLRDDRGWNTHDRYNPTPVIGPDNTFLGYTDDGVTIYPTDPDYAGWGSGHGTHVTSIITGYQFTRGSVSAWIKGVAPKVTIIPVLVLDEWLFTDPDGNIYFDYGGTDEMVAAGIRYIGDLAKNLHIKIIISMSLGGGSPNALEKDAIDYAIRQGVIVVASAGNSGYAGMGWPGAYPEVISVAAAGWTQEYGGGNYNYYWWWNDVPEKDKTKNFVLNWTHPAWEGYDVYGNPTTDPYWNPAYFGPTDTFTNKYEVYLADFSSRPNRTLGQKKDDLDVAAPGAAVRGPYKGYGPNSAGFSAVWGTSQAAPHVSGIAALLLQVNPGIRQGEMEEMLKEAAHHNEMPPDGGAYVSDAFSYWYPQFACVKYTWKDHDAGAGFLALDKELLREAAKNHGCH